MTENRFNLDASKGELRLEICNLQSTIGAIKACNNEIKNITSDNVGDGFLVAVFLMVIFMGGFLLGRISAP